MVDHAGLERRPLLRQDGVRAEAADHLEVILRLALVVLLATAVTDARMRRHEDPRLRPVHARPPRALGARHASAPVERGGLLAEVPDVAACVLRVPVRGALGELASLVETVIHDHARSVRDRLRAMTDIARY